MEKQFTPCPNCGLVGEIGNKCQFCGAKVTLKEGAVASTERFPQKRTVTPRQYAENISIFHKVEPANDRLLKVSIGNQYGLVNLNGDLVYPLGNFEIGKIYRNIVELGGSHTKTLREGSLYWDETYEEFKHREAITCEEVICNHYFNLETGEEIDKYGHVRDKESPEHILRKVKTFPISDLGKPIEFKNLRGEIIDYDYAVEVCGDIYAFYKDNTCLLGIFHNSNGNDCIIEEVKSIGGKNESKKESYIPIKRLNGETINLPVSYKIYNEKRNYWDWEDYDTEDIFIKWFKLTKSTPPKSIKGKIVEESKITASKGVLDSIMDSPWPGIFLGLIIGAHTAILTCIYLWHNALLYIFTPFVMLIVSNIISRNLDKKTSLISMLVVNIVIIFFSLTLFVEMRESWDYLDEPGANEYFMSNMTYYCIAMFGFMIAAMRFASMQIPVCPKCGEWNSILFSKDYSTNYYKCEKCDHRWRK